MTNRDYISGAVRTEAPVTDELLTRLVKMRTTEVLWASLLEAIKSAQQLDLLKKHIFYGKKAPWDMQEKGTVAPALLSRLRDPQTVRLLHAAMGMMTEAGEILEGLAKHLFDGEELDLTNVIEEQGDLFWYQALMANALNSRFEDIMATNNAKLRARYPDKFTEAKATTRDLAKERKTLEQRGDVAASFLCDTIAGKNGAKIIMIDNEHGFIHGYLAGSSDSDGSSPVVWSLTDGKLLQDKYHPGQCLVMADFKQKTEGIIHGRQ